MDKKTIRNILLFIIVFSFCYGAIKIYKHEKETTPPEITTEVIKNNTDFSAITDILKNVDIGNLINTFSNNNNNNKNDSNSFDFSNFDPKLFGRIQKIITTMNTNDPKRNLLISLKPFLRKSRQDKLNEYITILGIIKVLGIFDKKGSDDNVWWK